MDIKRQYDYPYEFHRGDAVEFLKAHGHEFDAIHASPPCQRWSLITPSPGRHRDLIGEVRTILDAQTKPWVMENVMEAPLRQDVVLCGLMFDLPLHRHRAFETSWPAVAVSPKHPAHRAKVWYPYDQRREMYDLPYQDGMIIPVYGNNAPSEYQYMAMGIEQDWMGRAQLIQAIPPAYTRYIGRFIMGLLGRS